ncbi:hypothetical protein [Agromyces sp. NBRC 114283]|uniref:hypothetical protein n=1 Tax=Agromyces sp. NBRC 114283 TaxID=2994521 RepID=UPI0024A017D8|nr:hypothetical protein [Agromyces sp. NBRC 114283]GLU88580.1 hypothetical protein Agsp01_08350 [Agromyces sp. NBRC 114283]
MQDVLAALASLRFGLVTSKQVVDEASLALVSGGSALDMALASLYPDDYESVDSLLVEGLAASGEPHSDDDVWWAFIGEVARRVDRGEMDVERGGRTIRRHTMLTGNSEQYILDLNGILSELDDGDGSNPEPLEALVALLCELQARAARLRASAGRVGDR